MQAAESTVRRPPNRHDTTMALESAATEPQASGKLRRGDSAVDIPTCSGESEEAPSGSEHESVSKLPQLSAWRRAAACCRSARALKAFTLTALCTAIVFTALFFAAGASRLMVWGVAMRCQAFAHPRRIAAASWRGHNVHIRLGASRASAVHAALSQAEEAGPPPHSGARCCQPHAARPFPLSALSASQPSARL